MKNPKFLILALIPALLNTLTQSSQASSGNAGTLPMVQIQGVFGKAGGKQVMRAQMSGGLSYPGIDQNFSLRPDPIWNSPDADALLARDTSDRFVIPAITATAGLTAAVSNEIRRAIVEKRPLDFQRLYRNSIVATASGFALGTVASPGLTNHFMGRAVIDASLRYLSKVAFMGKEGRENAGSFGTDIIIGALRGAVQSRLPPETLTWLPCQKQNLPADICNGLYAIVTKSLIQGSEEIASQVLARGLAPDSDRLSTDLLGSFFRGAAFGAAKQAMVEVILGAPQWMSPVERYRMSEIFAEAGLNEDVQQCMEKSTFLYGGLWSLFTRNQSVSFNLGTTSMIDREFYFLNSGGRNITSLLSHEVGGHCTQWLSTGIIQFLSHYLSEFAQIGKDPGKDETVYNMGNDQLACVGNDYECEASGIELIIVDQLDRNGNGFK